MAIAVWMLYVVDRLLDTRHLALDEPYSFTRELEARHLFHFRHRRAFLAGIAAAGVVLAALLPRLLDATLHFYFVEGVLLIAWFALIHSTRLRLPKELVIGTYFAVATFTPTLVHHPMHPAVLLGSGILFVALCALNCLFIHAWERNLASHSSANLAKVATALLILSLAVALTAGTPAGAIAGASAAAAALLIALHRLRTRLSRIHLRAAADLALLTPLLLLPILK
jgi:hypothetical protein